MTVYVVTGPPAGGKSTFVREHAVLGDLIVDYDSIVTALTGRAAGDPTEQPKHVVAVAQALRDTAINEAVDQHSKNGINVYIVHAMPDRHALNRYRKHRFQIITIDPGYDECIRRAQAERTPRQQALVEDWYTRRGLTV